MSRPVMIRRSVAALALFVAACNPAGDGADTVVVTGALADSPAVAPPPVTPAPLPVTLQIATKPGVGAFLTDATGRALYILEFDSTTTTTCIGECAVTWKAVVGMATPADSTVRVTLIDIFPLPDGTTQVTYSGKPLYYFVDDAATDIKGQTKKMGGATAYLISPAGKKITIKPAAGS